MYYRVGQSRHDRAKIVAGAGYWRVKMELILSVLLEAIPPRGRWERLCVCEDDSIATLRCARRRRAADIHRQKPRVCAEGELTGLRVPGQRLLIAGRLKASPRFGVSCRRAAANSIAWSLDEPRCKRIANSGGCYGTNRPPTSFRKFEAAFGRADRRIGYITLAVVLWVFDSSITVCSGWNGVGCEKAG